MASPNQQPIFEFTVFHKGATFANADGTNKKTVYSASGNGSRIDQIAMSTTDQNGNLIQFWINDGVSTSYHIGDVSLSSNAGYGTNARVDALTTLAPALGYIAIPSNFILQANVAATPVTSGKQVDILPLGGDY